MLWLVGTVLMLIAVFVCFVVWAVLKVASECDDAEYGDDQYAYYTATPRTMYDPLGD